MATKQQTNEIAKIIKESTRETSIGDAIEPTNLANDLADYFEKKTRIHCPKCDYVPTGFVFVEKCIMCRRKLKFPKEKFNREEFLKKAGVNEK